MGNNDRVISTPPEEIPGVEEHEDGEQIRINDPDIFDKYVRECGWDGAADWEKNTGVSFDEVKGKWFSFIGTPIGTRVYIEEGEVAPNRAEAVDAEALSKKLTETIMEEIRKRPGPEGTTAVVGVAVFLLIKAFDEKAAGFKKIIEGMLAADKD